MRLGLLLSFVLFSSGVAGAEFTEGRWYFRYERVPLNAVLEDLQTTTDARFELRFDATGELDADFSARSLDEALKRLLADYNYIMQYRQDAVTQQRYPHVIMLSRKPERRPPSSTAVVVSEPVAPVADSELVLQREGQQPYRTPGTIGGRKVSFLVDTGASVVALSASLARRLGLRFGARRSVATANGQTSGHHTVLSNVQLGAGPGPTLSLGQVDAIILPRMSMGDHVLLGMNVLERFELIQRHGELIIRPH